MNDFRKITLNEAIEILENDKTATTPIIFAVGNNHPELATTYDRELGNVVIIDAGKCYDIKKTVCNLATMSLFGGIYTV